MDTILTPGYSKEPIREKKQEEKYLIKDKYLSEYSDKEKKVLRHNLGVPSKKDIYTKEEIADKVSEEINSCILQHTSLEDPHGVLDKVKLTLSGYIISDGTTAFTAPLRGKMPTKDEHLTTKEYVDNLLYLHTANLSAHNILELVKYALNTDVFHSLVYTKKEVYTKKLVEHLLNNLAEHYEEEISNLQILINQLNSTITTDLKALKKEVKDAVEHAPTKGKDPVNDDDFTNKKYVDGLIYLHLIDTNAHNINNSKKPVDYYTKQETNDAINKELKEQLSKLLKTVNGKISAILKNIKNCVSLLNTLLSKDYVSLQEVNAIINENAKVIVNELDAMAEAFRNINERLTYLEKH